MKAFECSVIGGKVKKAAIKKIGETELLEFMITKARKIKEEPQFTSFFCQIWKPADWIKRAITDGAEVVLQGDTWERRSGEKTYRTFEVSKVVSAFSVEGSTPNVPEESNLPNPNHVHDPDDLPF